jgi:hypothetical protein
MVCTQEKYSRGIAEVLPGFNREGTKDWACWDQAQRQSVFIQSRSHAAPNQAQVGTEPFTNLIDAQRRPPDRPPKLRPPKP